MKKIFISHSSDDEKVVSLFVDKILKAGCGVDADVIVYTSREETGVVNGEDIPDAIKNGIRESALFFMMVSENYRKSEVCLNEMGAAWIMDGLVRKIMVLPGAGFDKIGWLMSLKKGTKLDDKEGLDKIHDEVLHVLGCPLHTATWNRSRDEFLAELTKLANEAAPMSPEEASLVPMEAGEEEYDLLDMRDGFESNMKAHVEVLNALSTATKHYSEIINHMTDRLNQLRANPGGFSASQVRGVLLNGTIETNQLAGTYEQQAPLLRNHFDLAIKFGIMMQESGVDEATKKTNRESFKTLIEAMINAKDEFASFRNVISGTNNVDKGFKKANTRLKKALDGLLDVVSFCISRAGEYRMA